MIKESDLIVDIESIGSECEEEPRKEQVSDSTRTEDALRLLVGTLSLERSDEVEYSSNSSRTLVKTSDDEYEDIESLVNNRFEGEKREHTPLVEKTQMKEKHRTRNTKKAPKPPRPRKGPSLSTSDLRLVKEISELVMKRRAQVERLKSLKKMRATKLSSQSSSKNSFFAMIITLLFFIIIIFQGFGLVRSSTLSFNEFSEPSAMRTAGYVPGHFYSKTMVK